MIRNVNVTLEDHDDLSPLSRAAINGYLAVVRHLLTRGHVNSKFSSGQTVLSFAAEFGQVGDSGTTFGA